MTGGLYEGVGGYLSWKEHLYNYLYISLLTANKLKRIESCICRELFSFRLVPTLSRLHTSSLARTAHGYRDQLEREAKKHKLQKKTPDAFAV